jgi:hypothetical protein
MASWPLSLWLLFDTLVVLLIVLTASVYFDYKRAGIAKRYLIFTSFTLIWFLTNSALNKIVHVHHYSIGMLAVAMLAHQSDKVTVLHGLANGVMIEGASRWGYDPIWPQSSKSLLIYIP